MKEFFVVNKNIDETIRNRGRHHQGKLNQIAEKLKEQLDEKTLFSSEATIGVKKWVKENRDEIISNLENDFNDLKKFESSDTPGHNFSHLMDNLNSALRIFEEYGDMSEAEKIEVVYAILGHDLSRYVENDLNEISRKDSLYLMPAMMGRKFKGAMALPEILQKRILFDIANGPVSKKNIRTADTVSQCDREQLLGGLMFARDTAFYSENKNLEFDYPVNEDYRRTLPMVDDVNDRKFMIQMEFFMRNIYSSTSPNGESVKHENIKENAVLLMLAVEGEENRNVYEQIFAPELGLVDRQNLHWSKKPLSDGLFAEAQKEKDEFMKGINRDDYEDGAEFAEIIKLLNQEQISLKPEQVKLIRLRLAECAPENRKNIWLVAKYGIQKRHEKRIADLKKLEKIKAVEGVSRAIAERVIENLKVREKLYMEI